MLKVCLERIQLVRLLWKTSASLALASTTTVQTRYSPAQDRALQIQQLQQKLRVLQAIGFGAMESEDGQAQDGDLAGAFSLNAYQVDWSDYENVLPTSVNVVCFVVNSTD